MSRNANASTHAGSRGANSLHQNLPHQSSINLVLERLENVKPAGQGYRANCPAHESKSRNTLAIKQADDGRVLLHCFGGCRALEIVHALGLELADLFDKPITVNASPQQQREWRYKAKMARWKASRDDLVVEMNVLLLAAGDVYQGNPLSQKGMDRMLLAGKRLRNAMGEL